MVERVFFCTPDGVIAFGSRPLATQLNPTYSFPYEPHTEKSELASTSGSE